MASDGWQGRPADREETCERLERELEEARCRYESANARCSALRACANVRRSRESGCDRDLAAAMREVNLALHEYRCALKRFSDHVLGPRQQM